MKKLFLIIFSVVSVVANAEDFPRYTEADKDAVSHCKSLDSKSLEDIKATMITSGVFSSIGVAGSGLSLGTSIMNLTTTKANKKTSAGWNIAGNIGAGVANVTSIVSTATAGTALAKINTLIDNVKKCRAGLGLDE